MDDADYAQAATDLDLNVALQNREPSLKETGKCYWCEEPITNGIYCDAYCGECYEKSTEVKA